ncbi:MULTISPECIES: hypothetical protein [unclassified Streptomyces]|uniref:hypothetical protein n=1 Tax=unclassified Streptomyces TaxID=2593676 RepID=UPI00081B265D|nr:MULTISPECIES: hypothetical protein [unclassified Streptomyces]MYQ82969.1 hypothetical protein [Streptomyces sp. SID4936]SCD56420.1 hypothetical protein GA0115234_103321 [Streptomyces sp. DvalAA-43]
MSTDDEFHRLVRSLREDPEPDRRPVETAPPAPSPPGAKGLGLKAGRSLAAVMTNRAMVPVAAAVVAVALSGAFLGYQHYATQQAAEQARSAQIDLERQRLEIEATKHEIEASRVAQAEHAEEAKRAEKARAECYKAAQGMSDWKRPDFLEKCTENAASNMSDDSSGMRNTAASGGGSGGSGMPSGASLLGGLALVGAGWVVVSRIKAKRHPA